MLKKVIIGGLGNQMFQYAALRGMQARYYPDEEICLSFHDVDLRTGSVTAYADQLKEFHVRPYRVVDRIVPGGLQRLLSGGLGVLTERKIRGVDRIPQARKVQCDVERRMHPVLDRFGIYSMLDGYVDFGRALPFVRDKLFYGYFESEKYFRHIREEIRGEFVPLRETAPENLRFEGLIRTKNSVCVHVRRGDFVGTGIDSYANVCGRAYFLRAISRVKELVPGCTFFFFSNQMDWVRENLIIGGECYYESGNVPPYETMRLMASCRHFILSNSSFSWWSQYLSDNGNKLVIAPDVWRRGADRQDIYLPEWEILPVD